MKKTILIIFVLLISSCSVWTLRKGRYTAKNISISAEIPQNWVSLKKHDFLITKDGRDLNEISISKIKVGDELAYSKKKIVKGMILPDYSEAVLNNVKLNSLYLNFDLIENEIISLNNKDCFKLLFRTKDKYNLVKKHYIYGFEQNSSLVVINFSAPKRHYFEKYRSTFIDFLNSLKIN